MDGETLMALAAVGQDEVERLSRQLGKIVEIDRTARLMLARAAIRMEDGEAYMREHVRLLVDDMVQLKPEAAGYKYEYEPAGADARRQAGHVPPNITFLA